jgi:SsrA-binding protein
MAKERGRQNVAQNRKARHDYHIGDTYEAGMVLSGTEVKSLRMGRASLAESFCQVEGDEVYLIGLHIAEYAEGTWNNHAPRRKRKLLLHRTEIDRIAAKTRDPGVTLVPLQLYFSDGYAKVEIAVASGKRQYDKRQAIAERESKREADRSVARARRGGA